eukprot:12889519-Prorocentrum_lima.AAC.1
MAWAGPTDFQDDFRSLFYHKESYLDGDALLMATDEQLITTVRDKAKARRRYESIDDQSNGLDVEALLPKLLPP